MEVRGWTFGLRLRNGAFDLRVGPRQPLAQLVCGFGRGPAVERHQRRRHAREPHDVRAPAVGRDGFDFDQVSPSPDDFFVSMNGGGHDLEVLTVVERTEFYARPEVRQAKRGTKAHAHRRVLPAPLSRTDGKKFVCPSMHRKFTVRPQLFHTGRA